MAFPTFLLVSVFVATCHCVKNEPRKLIKWYMCMLVLTFMYKVLPSEVHVDRWNDNYIVFFLLCTIGLIFYSHHVCFHIIILYIKEKLDFDNSWNYVLTWAKTSFICSLTDSSSLPSILKSRRTLTCNMITPTSLNITQISLDKGDRKQRFPKILPQ